MLVNVAVTIGGRTAVNLNYTTGPDVLDHCIKTCGLKTVVTSKLFLKKLKMAPPSGALYIDDLRKGISAIDKISAFAAARFFPIRLLETFCGARTHPTPDTIAAVIFSSGSTGQPKGVMLSHFNVASNIDGISGAVSIWPDDRVIGFLPFFHSFGYTVTLWFALSKGFGVVHHPNPLEARVIGDLVEQYQVTVMISTPTFLQNYIRRVEPHKFGSLEFVMTGAEKLPDRIAEAFEERFGICLFEGYGTTECSPVVSVNVDEYRSRGYHPIGHRPHSVGHPLPGVVVRIRDVETGEELQAGQPGLVHVRGANVMQGYVGMPEKTERVIKDGWYETGDIGFLDEAGFLYITDRLARFSKIGGEMVPHVRIEEQIHKAVGAREQIFAVTAVPDPAKGEQLAVLHTAPPDQLEGLREKLVQDGLPNLWIPRPHMFFKVDAIPVLGTGKLDLKKIRAIAHDRAGEGRTPTARRSADSMDLT